MGARDRVLAKIEELAPRMQAAARYVADHPTEVVVDSMRTVAHGTRSD